MIVEEKAGDKPDDSAIDEIDASVDTGSGLTILMV